MSAQSCQGVQSRQSGVTSTTCAHKPLRTTATTCTWGSGTPLAGVGLPPSVEGASGSRSVFSRHMELEGG